MPCVVPELNEFLSKLILMMLDSSSEIYGWILLLVCSYGYVINNELECKLL